MLYIMCIFYMTSLPRGKCIYARVGGVVVMCGCVMSFCILVKTYIISTFYCNIRYLFDYIMYRYL